MTKKLIIIGSTTILILLTGTAGAIYYRQHYQPKVDQTTVTAPSGNETLPTPAEVSTSVTPSNSKKTSPAPAPTASPSPSPASSSNTATGTSTPTSNSPSTTPTSQSCQGRRITFSVAPLADEDLKMITPMGQMFSSHVTPTDHQYFATVKSDGTSYKVRSPAAGTVTDISLMPGKTDDYRLVIQHSCSIETIWIHVNKLADKLQTSFDQKRGSRTNAAVDVSLEAGETFAYVTNGSFDLNIVDYDVTAPGFLTPKLYESESWKIHTVDTFDYFDESAKSKMLAKNLRSASPAGGKIDYDIDGKLVGNWFQEGTNGYPGVSGSSKYWSTHLSFAYNHYDPSGMMVSVGDWQGDSKQFGFRGNTPNPKDIGESSGVVKIEVVSYDYKLKSSGQYWGRQSYAGDIYFITNDSDIKGTILVQVLPNRKLKFEAFPGQTAASVSGFTANAKTYER